MTEQQNVQAQLPDPPEPSIRQKQRFKHKSEMVGLFVSLLVLAFAIYYLKSDHSQPFQPPLSPFEEFARSTENMVIGINAVSLPPFNDVSRYRIDCFRAANSIQDFPPFKHHEKAMTEYLTKSGDGMSKVGESLMIEHQRRISLLNSLGIEIRGIIKKLHFGEEIRPEQKVYFTSRMTFLHDQVQSYMTEVAKAKEMVENVISDLELAKKPLSDVLRELKDYQEKGQDSSAVAGILEELSVIAKAFGHLQDIVLPLEKLDFVLKNYYGQLLKVRSKIANCNEVSENDIEHLQRVGGGLHSASKKKDTIYIG